MPFRQDSPLLSDPSRAWEPFEPSGAEPWDRPRVAHLHRRAGFLAPWKTLERDQQDGPAASVDRLLEGASTAADGSSAEDFERFEDQLASRVAAGNEVVNLQAAWLRRMILTPHPLRERMTLFWHDHFATSNAKVGNLTLMWHQNRLLRRHALGSFPAMLKAMDSDPAMLLWLDSASNRKARPNENYAREVMELFTLGRGHYTEQDVQQAALAFTGSFVRGDRYRFEAPQHFEGELTVLGRTGRFVADDIAEILLEQPACAEFLAGKLFRHLVSETVEPSAELLAPLAESLRGSGYDIGVPVRTILRSRLFYDPVVRRRRVKSPVEFAVGTVRALEILDPTVSPQALAESCGRMGQALFEPPSVAGWDDGPAWINTTTSLNRTNLALAILGDSDDRLGKRLDPKALAAKHGATTPEAAADFYINLLVQDALDESVRRKVVAAARDKGDAGAREAATLVLTAPEYQLA